MHCSYNLDKPWNTPDAYSLYLIDDSGSRELLHREPGTSCWSPILVQGSFHPTIPLGTIDPELAARGLAQLVVADIYRGLDGIEKGTIKYIRVNEHVPRPSEKTIRKQGTIIICRRKRSALTRVRWSSG